MLSASRELLAAIFSIGTDPCLTLEMEKRWSFTPNFNRRKWHLLLDWGTFLASPAFKDQPKRRVGSSCDWHPLCATLSKVINSQPPSLCTSSVLPRKFLNIRSPRSEHQRFTCIDSTVYVGQLNSFTSNPMVSSLLLLKW